jgi:hypothetical protein
MNTAVCRALKTQSWKDLYQGAICESDLSKLPGRIAEAEVALAGRGRELYYAVADDLEEKESLDDAMAILQVLRKSLEHHPPAIQGQSN